MKKTHHETHDPRFGVSDDVAVPAEPEHEPPKESWLKDENARLQADNTQLRADVEHLQRQLVAPAAPVAQAAPAAPPEPAVLAIKNRRPNR